MKSLHVSSFSLPDTVGGTQVMLDAFSRSLRARGDEVTVFRHAREGSLPAYGTARGAFGRADVFSVGYDFSDCTSFRMIYRNERIDRIFEAVLEREAPDLVHIHHLTCLSTGILDVARRRNVPTVLSLWDFWLGCPRGQRIQDDLTLCTTFDRATCAKCCARLWPQLFGGDQSDIDALVEYDAWIRDKLEQVDVLTAPSRSTRQVYLDWGVRREIHVVECGLDHTHRSEPRSARREPLRIAYIGSVIPSKGAHVLLEAVQQLEPDSVTLDIHGEICPWHSDRGYGERLRALDRGTHDVTLHGRYEPPDVPRILAGVDVLVVPGLWYETYCLTIREGFLAGIPVVVSRLGAMAEAIEHGQTGLLVEPGDVADLAAALRRLRDEPSLYARLAAAPKPVVRTEAMIDRMLELYREATQRRDDRCGAAER